MKSFLIKYHRTQAGRDQWHQAIAEFIAALDNDPELKNRISYRCMTTGEDGNYYHIASPADDQAVKSLQLRDYFKRYTEKTKQVAGGDVVVAPLEIVAQTAYRS